MTDTYTSFEKGPRAGAPAAAEGDRKPRIAIMGEFSAGKSTLSNLLIGAPSLPVKVTATQLPPVWIAYGDEAPYRVDLDGNETPFDFADLSSLSVEDTMCIRVFHKSDALELCDLIDMPGISDPNMPSEVWERVLHFADGVIWCTHATQAWRQSEAAVWASVDPDLYSKSLLLLTRIDKITNDRDRMRVVRRVEKEADGLFAGVFPISLTGAIEAGEDHDLWQQSGAEAFAVAMIDVVEKMARGPRPPAAEQPAAPVDPEPSGAVSILTRRTPIQPEPDPDDAPRVMPQRITRRNAASNNAERPARSDTASRLR